MKFVTTEYMPYQFAVLPVIGILRGNEYTKYKLCLTLMWGFWCICFRIIGKKS